MGKETNITTNILRYLNSLPFAVAEKVQGTSLSSGKADINAVVNGRAVRIEVKTRDHKNTASKKQRINLKRWASAGAVCIIAYAVDDVKAVIPANGVSFRKHYYKDYGAGMVAERIEN